MDESEPMTDLDLAAIEARAGALLHIPRPEWSADIRALVARVREQDTERAEALALLRYALHLRMYGERAPGGNETWREFDQRCEALLRAQ